jgi:hypothetical protein
MCCTSLRIILKSQSLWWNAFRDALDVASNGLSTYSAVVRQGM